MSLVVTLVPVLSSCPPPLDSLGAQLVAGRHPMVEFLRAPHVIQQLVLDLQTSRLFCSSQFALKLAALPQ